MYDNLHADKILGLFFTSDRHVDLSRLVNPHATFGETGDLAYVCAYNFLAKLNRGKADTFVTPN